MTTTPAAASFDPNRSLCACGHLDLEDTPDDEVVLDLGAHDGLAHGRLVCRRVEDLEPSR